MKFSSLILFALLFENYSSFHDLLEDNERRHCDRHYPWSSLKPYFYLCFKTLYLSRNNQALINATGHGHKSFHSLFLLFYPYYKYWTVDVESGCISREVLYSNKESGGRQRYISAIGYLGLVLMCKGTSLDI